MTNYQTCSWCHHTNDVSDAARLLPVYCSRCGHRADVSRRQCDCGECLGLRGIGGDPSTDDQGGEALHAGAAGMMF